MLSFYFPIKFVFLCNALLVVYCTDPTNYPTPSSSFTSSPSFVYTVDFLNTKETKVFPSDGSYLGKYILYLDFN